MIEGNPLAMSVNCEARDDINTRDFIRDGRLTEDLLGTWERFDVFQASG